MCANDLLFFRFGDGEFCGDFIPFFALASDAGEGELEGGRVVEFLRSAMGSMDDFSMLVGF